MEDIIEKIIEAKKKFKEETGRDFELSEEEIDYTDLITWKNTKKK